MVPVRTMWMWLVLAPSLASAETPWKMLSVDGVLSVWARPMDQTNLREIEVRAHSPMVPERIYEAIWDASWQGSCPGVKTPRVLSKGDAQTMNYERLALPVVHDRDHVLALTRAHEGERFRVEAEGASTLGPPSPPGVVRMTNVCLRSALSRAGDGGTDLVYTSFGDPAGSVPAGISRAADERGPRDFVRAIFAHAAP